jgi:predicted DNA binding CopG/RHH family protein
MKTTIDLPDSTFRVAKATAAVQGISLKAFITQAVESTLSAKPNDWRRVITNLPRVPAQTLETVRLRVQESDLEDLKLQEQAARQSQG